MGGEGVLVGSIGESWRGPPEMPTVTVTPPNKVQNRRSGTRERRFIDKAEKKKSRIGVVLFTEDVKGYTLPEGTHTLSVSVVEVGNATTGERDKRRQESEGREKEHQFCQLSGSCAGRNRPEWKTAAKRTLEKTTLDRRAAEKGSNSTQDATSKKGAREGSNLDP